MTNKTLERPAHCMAAFTGLLGTSPASTHQPASLQGELQDNNKVNVIRDKDKLYQQHATGMHAVQHDCCQIVGLTAKSRLSIAINRVDCCIVIFGVKSILSIL